VLTANKKRIIYSLAFLVGLFFLSSLIPFLRAPVIRIIKSPLTLFSLVRQEIGGMIMYHSNMVRCQKLQQRNELLRRNLIDREELLRENARLKELLSLRKQLPYKVIAAGVIGRDPTNWSSVIIINKGTASGIRKGYACVSFLGLVGRVVEVFPTVSKVMLINDPSLSVSGLVQRSRQEGLVSGTLGGTLIMRYLPRESDIAANDTVVTSGLTDVYPKGILIGTVTATGDEFSSLSRFAYIRPSVDLARLEELLVIIP
jgi:rod shape-determining protein MreC